MNPVIYFGALGLLAVIGIFYSRFLSRQFGEDPARLTPAVRRNDGVDFVPTPTPVVFGHHFASIAGAGPIIGPVLAVAYGWGPAFLWVIVGGLFIGGVHDYLVAFMSMREDGRSIATIARRLFGRGPFIAMMLFLGLMATLLAATFLNTSATALTSKLDWSRMQLADGQTLFRVATEDGRRLVVIGGIASTSVVVITICAPLVGWLYIRRKTAVWKCSLFALAICAASLVAGLYAPIALPDSSVVLGIGITGVTVWKLLLAAYVLTAAGLPVWLLLQSRDFINVHMLYAGLAALIATLTVAAARGAGHGVEARLPAIDSSGGMEHLGPFWPVLFITVACGAVSGWHSLCAGGTTCKQLKSERAAQKIGYWGMILETVMAMSVVAVLVIGTTRSEYLQDVFPAGRDNNPVIGFAAAVGRALQMAFGVSPAIGTLLGMVLLEGFVLTTLDTAIRLVRYLLEEVWMELFGKYDVFASSVGSATLAVERHDAVGGTQTRGAFRLLLLLLQYKWVNASIATSLMLWFSFSAGILKLWKIFATSNQLVASLVLAIGGIWLLRAGRRAWYAMVPAIVMLATTGMSLLQLAREFNPVTAGTEVLSLFAADILLMLLAVYLVTVCIRALRESRKESRPAFAS